MTVSLYGVGPTINQAEWALLMAILGRCDGDEMVDTGLVVAQKTGTRTVSISAGNAVAAGVLAKSDVTDSVTFAANGSGLSRIDVVCLQIDWTSGGSFVVVQGTPKANPVAPALTRDESTTWQIPLARVTVANGAGQINSADIETCRPLKRRSKEYTQNISSTTVGKNSSGVAVATINIPDPGWDYRVWCSAVANVAQSTAAGHCKLVVDVGSTTLQTVSSGNNNVSDPVMPGKSSNVLSGATTVKATIVPVNADASISVAGGALNVLLLPA